MITALQKRPLSRPLLVWITGILLQSLFHIELIVGICLLLSLFLLLTANTSPLNIYSGRWQWGIVFGLLLLATSAMITEMKERNTENTPGYLDILAAGVQNGLAQKIDGLTLDNGGKAMLATLSIGYKQALDHSVRQRFAITGVSHILAVSGFHVAVVSGILSFLLSFIPLLGAGRWLRYLLLMLLVWSYVWITGLAPSSVRAGIMFSFFLTGRLLRRRGDSYNTLAASALCMLVYNPFYLFDTGFQLSFMAVWFILYLQPRFSALIEVRNPLLAKPWEMLGVTLAAQTGTLPLCLYYFNTFPVLFILVNLPVAFISTLLIPATLLWLILPANITGYASLQSIVEYLAGVMAEVVSRFSSIPFAAVSVSFGLYSLAAAYLLLFLFCYYLYKPLPRILLLFLTAVFVVLLLPVVSRWANF